MIPHILLLAATLSPAYASPLTPLSLTPIANLSSPYVGGGGDHEYYCTRLPQWTQPAAKQEDCEGALELFHYETMFDGGTRTSEFITPDARPRRHIRVEVTPRKYIYGKPSLEEIRSVVRRNSRLIPMGLLCPSIFNEPPGGIGSPCQANGADLNQPHAH